MEWGWQRCGEWETCETAPVTAEQCCGAARRLGLSRAVPVTCAALTSGASGDKEREAAAHGVWVTKNTGRSWQCRLCRDVPGGAAPVRLQRRVCSPDRGTAEQPTLVWAEDSRDSGST